MMFPLCLTCPITGERGFSRSLTFGVLSFPFSVEGRTSEDASPRGESLELLFEPFAFFRRRACFAFASREYTQTLEQLYINHNRHFDRCILTNNAKTYGKLHGMTYSLTMP